MIQLALYWTDNNINFVDNVIQQIIDHIITEIVTLPSRCFAGVAYLHSQSEEASRVPIYAHMAPVTTESDTNEFTMGTSLRIREELAPFYTLGTEEGIQEGGRAGVCVQVYRDPNQCLKHKTKLWTNRNLAFSAVRVETFLRIKYMLKHRIPPVQFMTAVSKFGK